LRRALSSVYGFIVIYLIIIAGLYAIQNIVDSQSILNSSLSRQEHLSSERMQERIKVSLLNNSINVENLGTVPSEIRYLIEQFDSSVVMRNVSLTLYPNSISSIKIDSNVKNAGVITSFGNTFTASLDNQCINSTYTVMINVTPKGSGYAVPQGIQNFCQGQALQLQAFPSKGYVFYMWNGSISSNINPLFITINKSLLIYAVFIPSLTMRVFPNVDGFSSGKNQTRVSDIVIYGASQNVKLNASLPYMDIKIRIIPSSLKASLNGSSAKLYVSYTPKQYSKNISLTITARGENNQTAEATYSIVETPPDGNCCSSLAYNSFFPRIHFSAKVGNSFVFFKNTLYTEPGTSRSYIQLGYRIIQYQDGWYYHDYTIASNCRSNTALDVYSQGDKIFLANLGLDGISFNVGSISGLSINWHYPPSAVGYCSTGIYVNGTKYVPYQWYTSNSQVISLTVDRNSNIYLAIDTFDPVSQQYHVEVLRTNLISLIIGCPEYSCRAISWDNVFISEPLPNPAVPSIMHTSNKVVLVYQVLSSECNVDNVYVSGDSGNSWLYEGYSLASGYPLCNDLSSGTVQGDSLYFGGVNSAGELSWWSFNLSSGKYFSPQIPYLEKADSGAMISAGSEIALVYTSSMYVHVAFSYRPESFWVSDTVIGYGYESVSLSSNPNSYQLIILCSNFFLSPNSNGVSAYFSTV
jgi:hypothetical protein